MTNVPDAQVVHGGLTAALLDETFGGLSVSIWRAGGMGLQVGYGKHRIRWKFAQAHMLSHIHAPLCKCSVS